MQAKLDAHLCHGCQQPYCNVQVDWFAPIVADAEAGFGGPLNCFELMKSMIKAGAAGVHFEDQLSSEKKCGHLGGKAGPTLNTFLLALCACSPAVHVCI